ncbi:T9SS type A sorting domain-containing protein [Lewinella cohaerens]|uniref:T9SS type A sorting domain-containing protein n=1 Tax=Lewinella cohaerens TaxID=70995 RepID=UPI000371CF93|nr:T9SS type A sorting domain-containing protein [Lewinella cohaerens]
MKLNLLCGFFILTQFLSAQTFTEISIALELDGVMASSIAFSDVNGDGNDDVLITGQNSLNERIAKLYTNDGTGNFTEMMGTPFDGVIASSIAFSDVNGDGNDDVLITGQNSLNEAIAKLYINDGMGNFTEMTDIPFDGVADGSIAFSDVNGDDNDDVLIMGQKGAILGSERIAKLYINDGMGNFTEMMDIPFDGVADGSIAFSDVNGDGNNDVLITGSKGIFIEDAQIAQLYINDGVGNFTEMTATPFEGVRASSIAFSDVNGDGYDDVLITGQNEPPIDSERIAKLYTNDGLGNFTEMTGTPFQGVSFGSIVFSDVNGDGNDDVLITGENISYERIAELYTNDGLGNFTEITDIPFDGVMFSSIAFSDVNGDGKDDVLITGWNSLDEAIAKLYKNDGMTSSIDDSILRFDLKFIPYPNPVKSGDLNITFYSVGNGFVNVKVYNLNGHLLSQQKEFVVIGDTTLTIDIGPLPSGSYFIQLDNGKEKGTAKITVQ